MRATRAQHPLRKKLVRNGPQRYAEGNMHSGVEGIRRD